MVRLKAALLAGSYPGHPDGADYWTLFSMDGLHQSYPGGYFTSLIHFACLYEQDPTDQVTSALTGLDPEQARFLQQLAWDTARAYPLSPVYSAKE